MADNIENRLQVGLGFKIDDVGGGLANLAKDADKINQIVEKLGQSMSKFENSSKNAGGTATKTFSEATNIMNQYQAGLINDAEAMKMLRAEQEKLNKAIKNADGKEYDNLVSQLAKVKKAYDKLDEAETKALEELLKKDQEAAKQAEKIAEQQYKEAVERNKAETQAYDEEQKLRRKSAKESADYFKQIFQEQENSVRRELQNTTTAYKQAMNERKASSKMLGEMLSPVTTNFSSRLLTSAAQWSGAYALVHEFQNLGREIVDIEYNTINNMRLMGDFSDELRESLNASAAEIARNTGIMITDAQEIQGAWVRINDEYAKSPELLGEMAEITSKFMNVGEIEDAESAVKLLNSTLLQFNLTTGDVAANAEEIANKFAYMADKTAMGTADEYAEGIAKMGANIKNMNGDVDDAIVLLSIVGDKLAKNGTEAGNSLNTFTAYMHRAKTVNLFDDLQAQMGDLDVSLRDGEKGLKSFEDSLTAIATAYQRLKAEGDEIGMNQIVEALGATRQRATAQAMLEAISDGETLQDYYKLLEGATASGNYLEQQNEALMSTLANQFKSLVATLQEAGMYISNSGLLDGLTMLMNGFEGLLKVITLVPQPFITGATAILGYKTAITGLNKIGEVTGLTDKLVQSAKFGTEAQIKAANATRQSADAYLNYQKTLFNTIPAMDRASQSYISQRNALTNYELAVKNNNIALASGTISIDKYNASMNNAHNQYLRTVQSVTASTRHTKEYTNANRISMGATKQSIFLKKQEELQNKKSLITLLAENGYKKASMAITKAKNIVETISNTLKGTGTALTIKETVANAANATATWALVAAKKALGVALNFVLSPTVLITTALAGLTWVFSQIKDKTIDYTESLSNLEEALQAGKERVEELKQAQASQGDTDGSIQKQINKQNELNESYERSIELIKQKQFYDDYYGKGDEDNKSEEIQSHIDVLNKYDQELSKIETKMANATKNIRIYESILANGGVLTESQLSAYNSATASLTRYQSEIAELNRNAGASAGSLIQYANEIKEAYKDGLINETDWQNKFAPLVTEIESYDNQVNTFLNNTEESISSLNATLSESLSFGELMNQMDSLAESTKSLVEAQNQLAQGAALSKDHLWELAMQYPELLYQSNLFADGSVAGQQAAIDAILDMKNQEFNNSIDLKILELEADKQFITDLLNLEEQKLNALLQGEAEAATGRYTIKDGELAFLTEFNNLEGQQVTAAENYKASKYVESAEAKVYAENQANEKVVSGSWDTGDAIATNIIEGSAAGADGARANASNVMTVFSSMLSGLRGLGQSVASALAGDPSSVWGNVNTVNGSATRVNNFSGKNSINPQSVRIDGKTVSEWINIQKEQALNQIKDYTVKLQGIDNAISNLNTFKNAGLAGVSNSYSDKGAQGGTGKSGDAAKAAEKAANAAKDAAKETEKIAEEIEKIAEQYVKNVESMQDRIAKALKEKYQEQYDERKKLLEKEHEERVQQIQDEIDKINGNTTQDKKSELERLYEKYEQWSKDDSTLGKARQKEYLDQIKELEKEIKIDELEKQLDEENEKYDQTIDKDSEFYDAILKKLDSQMTDEMLYREANDMIRNGKIDEITALLTKYDAQWDGWATLMGKTAGEIIAEEVALAIANYLDVVQGTITQDGGTHTNSITGGSSSASKNTSTSTHSGSSTGTSGGTVTTGSKVKINDTSTGMYYTSTSGGAVGNWSGYSGSYYVVNSNAGRVALARDNNVNNAIGWISKSKVTKLATGGYTGLGEGLAYLHAKERVLNARQTAAFENLIYNQLPKLERQSINGGNFGGTVNNFNKELVKVDVATINNYDSADVTNMGDNLDRMFRVSLQKAGIRKPR